MKTKFNYDDIVHVRPGATTITQLNKRAWIIGVFEERPEGGYFDKFPPGVVYSIEFEDGSSGEVHEDDLELEKSSP